MSDVTTLKDPRRYFEEVGADRSALAEQPPVCLYLEVTNRCNLLCETCPRTFEELEPPADMSWDLFTKIVDQVPNVARVVLHGVGEPMLVKELPDMIRYLKARGTYVLFNTNGTLMQPKRFQELIDTGLDELRVSLDAADRESYAKIRGKDFFNRIVRDVGKFIAYQKQVGATTPRISLWLTGLKETVDQLPEFVRLAAKMGITEVHLQRLVFDEIGYGKATAGNSLFDSTQEAERQAIEAAQDMARPLGVTLDASGATEPGLSLKRQDDRAWGGLPASVVAHVFHRPRTRSALLHRTLLRSRLQQLHAGRRDPAGSAGNMERRRLPGLPDQPLIRCAAGAVPELWDALEPLTVVTPTFTEAEAIGRVNRYTSVAQALHWATAALVLAAVVLAWIFMAMPATQVGRFAYITLHKSIGQTIFLLAVFRLVWRSRHPPPLDTIAQWERYSAKVDHWMLYGIMIVMPVSGYILSTVAARPSPYFWLFYWPQPALTPGISHAALQVHLFSQFLVYGFVGLHILGAGWHIVVRRDETLERMLPGRRWPGDGPIPSPALHAEPPGRG